MGGGSWMYTVSGDTIPIQVIDSRCLQTDENLWLKSLSNKLNLSEVDSFPSVLPKNSGAAYPKKVISRKSANNIATPVVNTRIGKNNFYRVSWFCFISSIYVISQTGEPAIHLSKNAKLDPQFSYIPLRGGRRGGKKYGGDCLHSPPTLKLSNLIVILRKIF
jgi:hypothetical protein